MSVLVRNVSYRGETLDLLVSKSGVIPARYRTEGWEHVIDAQGLMALPAFTDYHVHLRDPGQTEKEDAVSGARAAASGGFAALYCEPNTRPTLDSVETLRRFRDYVTTLALPVSIYPKVAFTLGQRGEVHISPRQSLVDAGAEGISSDGEPVLDRSWLVATLRDSEPLGLSVSVHCEETPASHDRVCKVLGNGPAFAREPELVQLALDALADAGTGALHIQHVSLAASARMIDRAKAKGLPVTSEVTPHHLLLCDEDIPRRGDGLDPNWKMSPPLRSRADMMAMRQAKTEGVIDIVATDHAPHTVAEKARPWDEAPFGVIGMETAFGACNTLVHTGDLSSAVLASALWAGDRLLSAATGNLVLIDPNHVWTVDPDKFYSKSRNCPFAGMTFKGKAMYTIIDGKVVMAEGEVLF